MFVENDFSMPKNTNENCYNKNDVGSRQKNYLTKENWTKNKMF